MPIVFVQATANQIIHTNIQRDSKFLKQGCDTKTSLLYSPEIMLKS